jgi:peptide chain release factor 3
LFGHDYIIGAVGVLQFEVTMARLKAEYMVNAGYEVIDLSVARWVTCEDDALFREFKKKKESSLAVDSEGRLAFLTTSEYQLKFAMDDWPGITFHKTRENN